MKGYTIILIVGLGLSHFAGAMPQPSPLNLGESLIPPVETRCNLSASNSTLDYGNQSRWQLQDVAGNSQLLTPGKRQLMVNVACPYTQTIRLRIRGTSVGNEFRYGASGRLRVNLQSAQLDGQSVQVALTTPEGIVNGGPSNTLTLQPDQTLTAIVGNQPAKGKLLMLQIEVEPVMSDAQTHVASRQINQSDLSLELVN